MRSIVALLVFCFSSLALSAQVKYDSDEIRQLIAFLNQPSAEEGKTNAEAIGITVRPTETNVSEWEKNLSIYTKNVNGIGHITDFSFENKGSFRLGGNFSIENFKYLQSLGLYGMGNEVKVRNCPELGTFRLMGKTGDEEYYKERKLEITGCPKLWQFRIECLVTEFTLDGSNALEQVNISYTNFSVIDFSTQSLLQWLILNNNAFSRIEVPKPSKWHLECKYNQLEPADLMALIRKVRGDELYLDWRFPTTEYMPQRIVYDSVPVGTKIDLREKATFKYGNPEKVYTGTFKWQYKDGATMKDISTVADMKQGVYTIPSSMANRTIIATYECEPFFTTDRIQYIINVIPTSKVKTPEIYNLTVISSNTSLGTVSGSGRYKAGELVPLKAVIVKPEVIFESWTENGDVKSNNDEYNYTMPARNVTITGNFEPKVYDLTAESSNTSLGTVSGSGLYKAGELVPLKATVVKPEAAFEGWTENGITNSGNATYTYTMPAHNAKVTGIFKYVERQTHLPQTPGPTITKDQGPTQRPTSDSIGLRHQDSIQGLPPLDTLFLLDTLTVPYLMLTSNLREAELSGEGYHAVGSSASVSAKAPAQYKFAGWILDKDTISSTPDFLYPITEECNICLHAIYNDVPVQPTPPLFEGKYACTIHFGDDQIPMNPGKKINMTATGYIEYRPTTKDIWSPYRDSILGFIQFDMSQAPEVYNRVSMGSVTQTGGFFTLTIFKVTENEIVASGGGYIFGSEIFKMDKILTRVLQIPYTLNNDGSVTLKKFNMTRKEGQPLYDITFYPAPNTVIGKKRLWFIEGTKKDANPRDEEKMRVAYWKLIKEKIMPKVYEELEKMGIRN